MTIDYGFASTDDVVAEIQGLPLGEYHVYAEKEEQIQGTEKNPMPVSVQYRVLDGADKGKVRGVLYNVNHSNPTAANIARQDIKKIADATGRPVVAGTAPIQGRVFKVIVDMQKGSEDRTQIKKYMPKDEDFVTQPIANAAQADRDEIPFN